ncbi:MAG: ABC transporter substrate-binding protein [Solirubrobacteraceae bacterium]
MSRIAIGAMLAAAALGVAACGSSEAGKTGGRNGGTATILEVNGGVDSLDPGYCDYQADYTDLGQTTQRWLYGWTPTGTAPVPDIATALPAVSDGGRTLTIHIRAGIHYSPPLASRTVTSADIKYAMERCFLASVGNGYVGNYYGKIEGAPSEPATKPPHIRGIQAPNPTTLVIHTTVPVGVLADAAALALPCTVPVPQSYAERFDRGPQSTYGQHEVFTGPYMIAGARSGTVPTSGYQPQKLLVLERNPSWVRSSDPIRPAHFDRIVFKGGYELNAASREVLEGQSMLSGDFSAPSPAILASALQGRRKQLQITPSGATRFISLNTTIAPLGNVDVRRAISAVIDRSALRKLLGGETLGAIATHFIPPSLPGFQQAGGYSGPRADFLQAPSGNVALAKEYMRKAGYANGLYSGPPLFAVADSESPFKEVAEALQAQLAQIGIHLSLREVPHTTMGSKFCTVPAAKVAICPDLAWERDFLDAQSMIVPIFSGLRIQPQGNTDTSQVNDPQLNARIEAAEAVVGQAKRAQAWGQIDAAASREAYVVPWLWENQVGFHSSNVRGVQWAFNGGAWDLTASSLE